MTVLRRSWEKNWPEVRCALTGGLPNFILARRPADITPGVPVFCYHVVQAATFERDLAHLRDGGYVTLDADQLIDHVQLRQAAPPRSVVLSFDDGAFNLYEVAFPLLRRFGMKAVAFVAPRFHNEADAVASRQDRPCTWSEIEAMHGSGLIDFQSHTFSHRFVPRWPEPAPLLGVRDDFARAVRGEAMSLEADLEHAKDEIERRLGKRVRHLAFPRYDGTDAAIAAGQKLGYEGFWWGVLPRRPINVPGDAVTHIVRVSGEFVRRLPGNARRSFASTMFERYRAALRREAKR